MILLHVFYTTLINVDFAKYEISGAKVCDNWQGWYKVKYRKLYK